MKLKSLIFLSLILLIAGSAFAQKPAVTAVDEKPAQAAKLPAVSEVLAKFVEAIGGREANEKIKNRVVTGGIEISPMGIKGTMELYTAAPDKVFSNANITGIGTMMEGYDGKLAWTMNPMQGNREKSGRELLQAKIASNFYRDINLDKLYTKLEVKGVEKIGDKDAYIIVATPDGIPAETFYFDKVSGLLLRTDSTVIAPEGTAAVKTFYEDYRTVDGIKVAFKMRSVLPQYELITTISDVKHNVTIDDAKFAKPK
jgi:outer membrane lipoprotein-sorting protein